MASYAAPMLNKHFATKLLFSRLVDDTLNQMIDPTYKSRMNQKASKYKQEKGKTSFWGPNKQPRLPTINQGK
jgi:hypothetical protein